MDRLVTELEAIWNSIAVDGEGQPTGVEWLPVDHVGHALCTDLGYEDMPEFEDALKGAGGGGGGVCAALRRWGWRQGAGGPRALWGPRSSKTSRAQHHTTNTTTHNTNNTQQHQHRPGTFEAFLDHLPHVVKETRDGRCFFQIRPEPPRESWVPCKMTVRIESTKDLWRVCLKSPYARIEIPELEFEISADGKRHIDSVYNHIGAAIYNLGNYVRQAGAALSEDHKSKIMDTVIALNVRSMGGRAMAGLSWGLVARAVTNGVAAAGYVW